MNKSKTLADKSDFRGQILQYKPPKAGDVSLVFYLLQK